MTTTIHDQALLSASRNLQAAAQDADDQALRKAAHHAKMQAATADAQHKRTAAKLSRLRLQSKKTAAFAAEADRRAVDLAAKNRSLAAQHAALLDATRDSRAQLAAQCEKDELARVQAAMRRSDEMSARRAAALGKAAHERQLAAARREHEHAADSLKAERERIASTQREWEARAKTLWDENKRLTQMLDETSGAKRLLDDEVGRLRAQAAADGAETARLRSKVGVLTTTVHRLTLQLQAERGAVMRERAKQRNASRPPHKPHRRTDTMTNKHPAGARAPGGYAGAPKAVYKEPVRPHATSTARRGPLPPRVVRELPPTAAAEDDELLRETVGEIARLLEYAPAAVASTALSLAELDALP